MIKEDIHFGAKERGFTTAILQNGILSTKPDVVGVTYRDREIVKRRADWSIPLMALD